ncbi:cyclin-like protein [Amylostereum chailletii]|nr:cyclin-like protein [Amylostereum chailletii]
MASVSVPGGPFGVDAQWLFPIECLSQTPTALDRSMHDEMYDRARGIEFLFRLGSSIGLHIPGIMTAATWFHRFFMRYSMEDYHRQNVAAACIFLATKTEECGRKLKDVARVMVSKLKGVDPGHVPDNGKDVEEAVVWILQTEEVLLDALCFDFVVDSPHGDLVTLFEACDTSPIVQDYAFSIAHDSYRTPLCVLCPPRIIAAACFVLAQKVADGPNSLSLDARISSSAPTASLPTPPSHKPTSPDASRLAIDFFCFDDTELLAVADSLDIILEFYNFQSSSPLGEHLDRIVEVCHHNLRSIW